MLTVFCLTIYYLSVIFELAYAVFFFSAYMPPLILGEGGDGAFRVFALLLSLL